MNRFINCWKDILFLCCYPANVFSSWNKRFQCTGYMFGAFINWNIYKIKHGNKNFLLYIVTLYHSISYQVLLVLRLYFQTTYNFVWAGQLPSNHFTFVFPWTYTSYQWQVYVSQKDLNPKPSQLLIMQCCTPTSVFL